MRTLSVYVILGVIACFIVILIGLFLVSRHKSQRTQQNRPTIYCLMVTGKDDSRIEWAKHSVANFLAQDYPEKRLVIVNHHPHLTIIDDDHKKPKEDLGVYEFKVKKTETMTLGDLRNISLDLVAHDALWTTWDDDDWRSPKYLSWLQDTLQKTAGASSVTFTTRIEYNITNGFIWKMMRKSGYPLVLAPFDRRVRYQKKDTMEDTSLLDDIRNTGQIVHIIENNDPKMYIRVVHDGNTSRFVNKNKQDIIRGLGGGYVEMDASVGEQRFAREIMKHFQGLGVLATQDNMP